MIITQYHEVLLSWLCGLAPIGQVFTCERQHAVEDLEYGHPSLFNQRLTRLIDVGAIELLAKGFKGVPCIIRVLKRPESFNIVFTKNFNKPSEAGRIRRIQRAAKPKKKRLISFAGYDETERVRL